MENRTKNQLENEKLEQIHVDIDDDDFNNPPKLLNTENDNTKKQKGTSLHKSLNFFCIVYLLGLFSILLLNSTLGEYTIVLAAGFGCLILISIGLVMFNCIRWLVNSSCRVIKGEKFTPSKGKKITTGEIIGIIILIYITLNILNIIFDVIVK